MGLEHGAFCVGCCWGLMVVLFALGVMSLTWMVVIGSLIAAQKLLPGGARLPQVFAVLFVAAGVWVASAPASVPGLTRPDSPAADRARMRMMNMTPTPGMTKPMAGDTEPKPGAMKPDAMKPDAMEPGAMKPMPGAMKPDAMTP